MAGKSFSVNNAAAAAITFNPTVLVKDGTQYVDPSTSLATPRMAVVKHTMPGVGSASAVDRHYVQFQQTAYDANGKAFQAAVGISIVLPRTVVTPAQYADLVAFAKNFLSNAAFMASLITGDY